MVFESFLTLPTMDPKSTFKGERFDAHGKVVEKIESEKVNDIIRDLQLVTSTGPVSVKLEFYRMALGLACVCRKVHAMEFTMDFAKKAFDLQVHQKAWSGYVASQSLPASEIGGFNYAPEFIPIAGRIEAFAADHDFGCDQMFID